jgi:hypothetical protein
MTQEDVIYMLKGNYYAYHTSVSDVFMTSNPMVHFSFPHRYGWLDNDVLSKSYTKCRMCISLHVKVHRKKIYILKYYFCTHIFVSVVMSLFKKKEDIPPYSEDKII